MTTEISVRCSEVISRPYIDGVARVLTFCNAPALWENAQGEPRCEEHAGGDCSRIGKHEGEEA